MAHGRNTPDNLHSPFEQAVPKDSIECIASREIYRNPWMTVREDDIRRADDSAGIFGVVDRPTAVFIVPWDGERLCLVNQFRYPVGKRSWEFPAGTAPGLVEAEPYELAARELREETGLKAGSMVELGFLAVAPGFASQRGRTFLATDLSEGKPERELEEQDMYSRWFSKTEFEKMLTSGEIFDAQTIAAYGLFYLHQRTRDVRP